LGNVGNDTPTLANHNDRLGDASSGGNARDGIVNDGVRNGALPKEFAGNVRDRSLFSLTQFIGALAAVACLLNSAEADAQSASFKEDLRTLLGKRHFRLESKMSSKRAETACRSFIRDVMSQGLVGQVAPKASTNDASHPALARYQSSCKGEENRQRGWSETTYVDLASIGDRRFHLFELDADRGSAKSQAEVIYAEVDPKIPRTHAATGGYYVIDLNRCEIVGGYPVPSSDINSSISGIVRYKGGYYVVVAQYVVPGSATLLAVDLIDPSTWQPLCGWTSAGK
jgi:hypothetical protein